MREGAYNKHALENTSHVSASSDSLPLRLLPTASHGNVLLSTFVSSVEKTRPWMVKFAMCRVIFFIIFYGQSLFSYWIYTQVAMRNRKLTWCGLTSNGTNTMHCAAAECHVQTRSTVEPLLKDIPETSVVLVRTLCYAPNTLSKYKFTPEMRTSFIQDNSPGPQGVPN